MPYRGHYVDLDPEYKDAFGDPLPRMTFDFEEQDKELAAFMSDRCGEIMKEMGADAVDKASTLGPYEIMTYQSTHNTGGIVMGASPGDSAVNSYLQMWDAENVFVVGASAFPHNSGYNPTDTVGALAYRAADGIVKYSKSGGMLV